MTTDQLLEALAREYPNGVSFDPMALRLLRQKVPFADCQIEELKTEMFQFEDGLWFSREMISDDESRLAFREQAAKWLMKYGCFSVERLFESYCGVLHHISTPEYCAVFLRHLGFTVAVWGKGSLFCFQLSPSLDECLTATSKKIVVRLEEVGGTLSLNEIEEAMSHLTVEALEGIRAQFLPDVFKAEIGGVPCWRSEEAIPLPEDFAEKLTTAVDTLVMLDEKVTAAKLEFAMNLCYCIRFREEYALSDNGAFMRVCAKNYQGENDVFPNTKKPCENAGGLSATGKRMRSQNTRFVSLGVPIGAELVFTKDSHITCTVHDASNQVEHDGKVWAISALANHLLNVSAANGFDFFSYDGETLLSRRLRLERDGNKDESRAEKTPPPAEIRVAKSEAIGFEVQSFSKKLAMLNVEGLEAVREARNHRFYTLALAAVEAARAHLTVKHFADTLRAAQFSVSTQGLAVALQAAKDGKTVEQVAAAAAAVTKAHAAQMREKRRAGGLH